VTQDGKYLTVSPESLNFSSEGGTKTVTVSTDGTFTAMNMVGGNWFSVSTNGNTITIDVPANYETESRSGSVWVYLTDLSEGWLSRDISIIQDGNDHTFKGDVTFEDYGELKPLD